MGTRADFYVGRGADAEWIGSIGWDGYPDGVAESVLSATTPDEFRAAVEVFFAARRDATRPADGWPWPWPNSHTTDYAYAIDDGRVHASCFGYEWFDPKAERSDDECDESRSKGKVTVFPDMSAGAQRERLGAHSGVIAITGRTPRTTVARVGRDGITENEMHYTLEVIMPPTADMQGALSQILYPFSESGEDEDGHPNRHTFFDYWQIGGRWSGRKLQARLGEDKIQAFRDELAAKNVTISGLIWGKPELQPASQQEMVDAMWREHFPESGVSACPMFSHSPKTAPMDVCAVADLPAGLTASRCIVAGVTHDGNGLEAKYMVSEDDWNGVNHQRSTWDMSVKSALAAYEKQIEGYREDYREKCQPRPDWLVVTIDYHS